ncbi:DUF4817 domain-containing protein [Trichonephila clavipes]|nr:DUF4817 domain-containing protein [Trichonephila clavipes]
MVLIYRPTEGMKESRPCPARGLNLGPVMWKHFTPNAAVLFVDVAIQPEVRFIAKQNSLMKIGNNGNLVLGPFDESKSVVQTDEAHFWLNGYVNKQNCRIWSEANPQVYVETPLHPEKLTVWCALWAGGIIGLYFFKNDEGHNVTFNGDRYRAMITNFFIPELNNHDVQELWFPTRRCNMSHSSCHNRFIESHFG